MQTFWNKRARQWRDGTHPAGCSGEKYPVGGVIAFFPVRVAEFGEVCLEFGGVPLRDIDPGEDAAVIRTVIPIVKQADIPVGTDGIQEIQERARAFREFEAVEAFVGDIR